jgi:hypothetical protein
VVAPGGLAWGVSAWGWLACGIGWVRVVGGLRGGWLAGLRGWGLIDGPLGVIGVQVE